MKRLLWVAALAVAIVPAAAPAAGPAIPQAKYKCYVFYAPGIPTYTARWVKIVSATKYTFFNSKSSKGGTYALNGSKIRFKTGPLKGKPGTHKVYGSGDHGIEIQMTPGTGGRYSCSS
jgi:hypothetical protein